MYIYQGNCQYERKVDLILSNLFPSVTPASLMRARIQGVVISYNEFSSPFSQCDSCQFDESSHTGGSDKEAFIIGCSFIITLYLKLQVLLILKLEAKKKNLPNLLHIFILKFLE